MKAKPSYQILDGTKSHCTCLASLIANLPPTVSDSQQILNAVALICYDGRRYRHRTSPLTHHTIGYLRKQCDVAAFSLSLPVNGYLTQNLADSD